MGCSCALLDEDARSLQPISTSTFSGVPSSVRVWAAGSASSLAAVAASGSRWGTSAARACTSTCMRTDHAECWMRHEMQARDVPALQWPDAPNFQYPQRASQICNMKFIPPGCQYKPCRVLGQEQLPHQAIAAEQSWHDDRAISALSKVTDLPVREGLGLLRCLIRRGERRTVSLPPGLQQLLGGLLALHEHHVEICGRGVCGAPAQTALQLILRWPTGM